MTLIDTSIWVQLLREGSAVNLVTEISEVVTCGPVVQEVLQGFDTPKAFREAFLALPRLEDPLRLDLFLEAADIYQTGRRTGRTIRSAMDCLIAAIAIRHEACVWHRDRDYTQIARYTKLVETT
jgi:predicted nucleic acid-binding protein